MLSKKDVDQIPCACRVTVSPEGDSVSAGRISVPVGDPDVWFAPVLKDLMPRSPRGDYRERTVNLLVRDAIVGPGTTEEERLFERETKDGPGAFYSDETIADPLMRAQFGEILADHYVIETTRGTKFLFPFQSDLPGNYKFKGRYKLFNGLILAFFAKPGSAGGFNTELLDRFYALFNDTEHLSLLDQQALRIARQQAEAAGGAAGRSADASKLTAQFGPELDLDVFFPEVHTRLIQSDLDRALQMHSLGRKDRVNAVLQVFYFHLALYFWRAAYVLDEQAMLFLRYLAGDHDAVGLLEEACRPELEDSPFRNQIKFRATSTRPRSVSRVDPCSVSFREVNNRRLLLLPVNLSLLGAARRFLGQSETPASFADLSRILDSDPTLRSEFDCAFRIAAAAAAEKVSGQQRADLIELIHTESEPGFLALREALLKGWRRELRRSTTDITAQLMRRGGKGISATRGSVQFFELGQDILLLLAKLVAGDEAVRYRDFLERLSLYGLAPQDREEEDVLADVLRSLQLLDKYSDTGEAMYVKHFL